MAIFGRIRSGDKRPPGRVVLRDYPVVRRPDESGREEEGPAVASSRAAKGASGPKIRSKTGKTPAL